MKIVIAGATGLVGKEVLELLLQQSQNPAIALTRKALKLNSPHENKMIDWETWEPENFSADVFVCALGTTIKASGSKENFKKVDFHFVKKFAEAAKKSNAKKFIFISANGANKNSMIFYNQIKGEAEEMLRDFHFDALAILRPSLLIGERIESRPFEKWAQLILPNIDFLLQGPLKKYQTIKATTVAKKIVDLIDENWIGNIVLESNNIQE